jgi:hypothetical protein
MRRPCASNDRGEENEKKVSHPGVVSRDPLSAVHFAAAAEHHSGRVHHHAHAGFRDSNAYAVPAYRVPQQPDWDRYSGYAGIDGH